MRRVAILVTGSRDWTDREAIRGALLPWKYAAETGVAFLIHGDCGQRDQQGVAVHGADLLAADRAAYWGWTLLPMPAQWRRGKHDGPARNQRMVDVLLALQRSGYDCHVRAFPLPSSKGTWDCVRRARRAGFEVDIREGETQP